MGGKVRMESQGNRYSSSCVKTCCSQQAVVITARLYYYQHEFQMSCWDSFRFVYRFSCSVQLSWRLLNCRVRMFVKSLVIHQSIPATPRPPPPELPRGVCPPCQSRRWGICKFCSARGPGICQPRGYSKAFDTHAVSYQNIITQRILLEQQACWLDCQGQEKIGEGCKDMFSILCTLFFIAYQARITW